jgi:hypothetical protein
MTMMWSAEPVAAEEPEADDAAPVEPLAAGELDDELEQAEAARMRPSVAAEAVISESGLTDSPLQGQASL